MMAFLTLYSLLVVIFACLFRIAQFSTGEPQFFVHGKLVAVSFSDAVYFSVATLSTVGYGDIAPATPLTRALAAIEVISGLLILLFGFSEIMQHSGLRAERPRHAERPPHKPDHQL